MQFNKQFQSIFIIGLALLFIVYISFSLTTATAAQQPTLTPIGTPTPSFIEPLSPDSLGGPGCIKGSPGGTPTGTPDPVCCVSGMVYFNGSPVEGAEVTIASIHGQITVYTYQHLGTEQRPYYEIKLSDQPLMVAPNEIVTITASYSGYSTIMTHTAQVQGQQVDLVLARPAPNSLGVEAQLAGSTTPGQFGRPLSVALDSLGNVYVVGYYREVQVFDPNGNFLRRWGTFGNQPGAFGALLSSIEIDEFDRIYVTDFANGRVQVFATDGTLLKTLTTSQPQNGQVYGPVSVAIGPDGSIYVVEQGGQSPGVQKFDRQGNFVSRWGSPGKGISQFDAPFAIDVDKDGFVYVADSGNHRIQKFMADGTPIITGTAAFSPSIQLNRPVGVAVGGEGNVYVTEASNSRLLKFGSDGQLIKIWGNSAGAGAEQFHQPFEIKIHKGEIYIADSLNTRVRHISQNGDFLPDLYGGGNSTTGFTYPVGFAFDVNGNVIAVDMLANRITKLSPQGHVERVWDWYEPLPGVASYRLGDIATYLDGTFLVTDIFANQIKRFSILGDTLVPLGSWGEPGDGDGQFKYPNGITVDNTGRLYVADTDNNRIQVLRLISDTLHFETSFGGYGPEDGKFIRPWQVILDQKGGIWVADGGNARIQKFKVNGNVIEYDFTIPITGTLGNRNADLAVDQQNHLYVAGGIARHQLWEFDDRGTFIRSIGEFGNGIGQYYSATALALANDGTFYIGDTGRIQILRPMGYTAPIASIIKVSTNGLVLHENEILTIVGQGAVSDGTKSIVEYQWSSVQGGRSVILTGQTAPTLVMPAADLPAGAQHIALRVRDNANTWSQLVVQRIYVAPRKSTPTALPPTPTATPTPTVTNTPTPVPAGVTPPPTQEPTDAPTLIPSPIPTVTCIATWTMMLYLVGDYADTGSLIEHYNKVIDRLPNVHSSCVTIVVQTDGPTSIRHEESLDTIRWLFVPGQQPTPSPPFEAEMDDPEQLILFIEWAQHEAPAEHYYLAIANHGQGSLGLGWDHTTDAPNVTGVIDNDEYLTNIEVGEALDDFRIAPIDILHLDACSMALFDVFYQMRHKVQYIIASQYLAWSFFAYDDYAQQISINTSPEAFAKTIVERYAAYGRNAQVPFTLSAIQVWQINEVQDNLDILAVLLKAWADMDRSGERIRYLLDLRTQQPTFDSTGDHLNHNIEDSYIDLLTWAKVIQTDKDNRFNAAIRQAAEELVEKLQIKADGSSLILANEASSQTLPSSSPFRGAWIDLNHAHGVSLYYPTAHRGIKLATTAHGSDQSLPTLYTQIYADYINNHLFDSTFAFRWDEFLSLTLGTPAPTEVLATPPAPMGPAIADKRVYLPLIQR